ncbi:MAG: carboxypeptidase-like regulatory domain-containing protein, partial [Marinilabiliales bacterium]|nr:carboxypeptidase-like regulatory domain-containing protein [Marinilabiliales bacterium]
MKFLWGFFLLLLAFPSMAQKGQTIKGTISDALTQQPLPGATIQLLHSTPPRAVTSDAEGHFRLEGIMPGRYDLLVRFVGYDNYLFREIVVGSAKEVVLNALMKESTEQLGEVSVVAQSSKERPINPMATLSARQLSTEEANRYAGGYDDPARLAGSFAGVASELGNNGIVIRGNSPRYMLWRMEGTEISNPTHFANVTTFGAGGITALSSQMLANSDFYTGAFPAEFGNALSGVFDIRLRNGNNEKHEYTAQAGVVGLDFSAEGPLQKGKEGSYLFNYRYSTFALLGSLIPEDAGKIGYQDLSFKINLPTKKAGNFSLWAIGAVDSQHKTPASDPDKWLQETDIQAYDLSLRTGAIGLTHKYLFGSHTYLHTTLSASGNAIHTDYRELDETQQLQPKERVTNDTWKFSFATTLNHKFGTRHTFRSGIILNQNGFNVDNKKALSPGDPLLTYEKERDHAFSMQAFGESSIKIGQKTELNIGLNSHYFGLSGEITLEPRAGMTWQLTPRQTVGVAYGLHSRLEMIGFYLAREETPAGIAEPNRGLQMTKAHHLGLSYDLRISEKIHFKMEPYYQYLFDVPVVEGSSYSLLNLEQDWFFNKPLTNKGTGTNIGIDLTLERFLNDGYYYMVTA